MNTRCRRCNHAIALEKRDIHFCRWTGYSGQVAQHHALWVITVDAYAVAYGPTLESALWDEQRWLNKAGLLPDVPWSAT